MSSGKLILSKNVDRSPSESAELTLGLDNNADYYLALHLQDVTNTLQEEFLRNRSCHLTITYHQFLDRNNKSSTALITALNDRLATDTSIKPVGNERAAGLLSRLKLRDRPDGNHIFLADIYIRPTTTYVDVANLLCQIYTGCEGEMSRLLVTGDVNASSPLWDPTHGRVDEQAGAKHGYYQTKIQRGATIAEFIRRHNMTVLAQNNRTSQPTYVSKTGPNNAGAYIDIAIAGQKIERIWPSVTVFRTVGSISWPRIGNKDQNPNNINTLSKEINKSEHRYLLVNHKQTGLRARSRIKNHLIIKSELIRKEDFMALELRTKKIRQNWRKIESRDDKIEQLEYITNLTMNNITSVQFKVTQITRTSKLTKRENLNNIIKRIRRIKNKLRNWYLKMKLTRPTRIDITKNKIYKKTKNKLISKIRAMCGQNSNTIWDKTKHIKWTDQQTLQLSHLRDPQKLNELAGKLFPNTDCKVPREQLDKKSSIDITNKELEIVENMLRNKKYKGPDGIWFKTFNKCLELIPELIREIAKMSFNLCHIPEYCCETKGTIIPKKMAGKYRIVHVATPLAAYLELIALNRFQYSLETNHLLHRDQFGFRCGRGRNELVTRIIASTAEHRTKVANL